MGVAIFVVMGRYSSYHRDVFTGTQAERCTILWSSPSTCWAILATNQAGHNFANHNKLSSKIMEIGRT